MIEQHVDAGGQLDAVERSVTTRDGDSDDTIHTSVTISQSYATDVDDLWNACSTAERLARWFAPVTGDLRLGGRFQVQGNAGGTIEACDPPNGFTATWEFGGETSYLEARLEADGDGRSRLTLIHTAEGDIGRWKQFGPGAVGVGWDLTLLGLALHVKTGSGVPAEASEWGESAQAKEFMAGSSRRWGDAAISGGAPEADARAAEARTTAFYTGEEPPGDHESARS
jgi:uncharacterized protein YndB with AHSA1/START domain